MTDYDQLAFDAIEAIAKKDFKEFANGNWVNAVPTGDPPTGIGFDSVAWPSEARKIAEEFNVLIKPNGPVRLTDEDYVSSATKRLQDYQRFLADLAKRLAIRSSIAQFRGI